MITLSMSLAVLDVLQSLDVLAGGPTEKRITATVSGRDKVRDPN